MENNQHNRSEEEYDSSQNIEILRGRQPGQQPPIAPSTTEKEIDHAPSDKDERHSESSLPKHNETLGTP